MTTQSFTGRARGRRTRRSVRIAEKLARALISIGGVGTILAVTLILVFLVWVVLPLFAGARFDQTVETAVASPDPTQATRLREPLRLSIDEYQVMAWTLNADGSLSSWRVDTGERLAEIDGTKSSRSAEVSLPAADGPTVTASSVSIEGDEIVLGFSDGSFRAGEIGFATSYFAPEAQPELIRELGDAALARHEQGLVQRTPEGQLRLQELAVKWGEPVVASATPAGSANAIALVDHSRDGAERHVCTLDANGRLVLHTTSSRENMLTGETTTEASDHEIVWHPAQGAPLPRWLLLSGSGDKVFLAWPDGRVLRFDARDRARARLAEEVDLVEGDGELTSLAFLFGKNTLISGDSLGRVRAWFTAERTEANSVPEARRVDGATLVLAHELAGARGGPATGAAQAESGRAVTRIASSARNRVVAIASADGSLRLYHVTSHKMLALLAGATGKPIEALAIAPKEDGVLALAGGRFHGWRMELGHPEASLAALFTPVWYEGYPGPAHTWQSSSGTDEFEPKLGLVPLVFGTIKATLYSMLFGAPLALLAALYTSEFLSPRLRAPLKSLTEMMASLPSVVLGFLAAIVIAPYVQTVVPAVLAAFFTVPGAILLGAYLWQMLPQGWSVRLSGTPRFLAIAATLPIGIALALALGPTVERAFFQGNIRVWLDGREGEPFGGWVVIGLPVCALLVWLTVARVVNPWVRRVSASWNRARCARFDAFKFVLGCAAAVGLACALAWILAGIGLDPRGGVLDKYDQRNALIVGFVMGFAVIPIIYTLAEDALSSVPAHLRLASLGAGATPWQTAMRVVAPTALSGLFSAVMIGLGRAVGETMIVLMATGNTPVMSWNIFNGFRTLSANIATELPEAVENSTHYRTLFLAALVLFAFTFTFNTFAEIVRQRFRRQAYQL